MGAIRNDEATIKSTATGNSEELRMSMHILRARIDCSKVPKRIAGVLVMNYTIHICIIFFVQLMTNTPECMQH